MEKVTIIPYESIYEIEDFFNTQPFKAEKMRYQIIEADARRMGFGARLLRELITALQKQVNQH